MNTTTPKQREELDLAHRLLVALGHGRGHLTPSDKPDVLATITSRRVGIEVTQFHADEQPETQGRGSQARAQEAKLSRARPDTPYPMWISIDPVPGLVVRINDKIKLAAGYDRTHFDELWLLVAGGLPKLGSLASTVALPFLVDLAKLNAATNLLLASSPYDVAYIHTHLPAGLFCWLRREGWRQIELHKA